MKINTKELIATVKLAAKLKAGTLSFGKQFRLRPAGEGKLTVESTNGEIFFIRQVYGEGTLERAVLVNRVALTKALVSAAKRGNEVELVLVEGKLAVTAGAMQVRLMTADTDDMPEPPTIADDAQSFVIENAKTYLGAVAKYLCKEGHRPNLECVCLTEGGQAVATDGHRLLSIECLDEKPTRDILINGAAVRLALATLLSDDFAINVDDVAIEITAFNGTKVIVRRDPDLGTFPAFANVLPATGASTFFEVGAEALKALAVDMAPWTGKTKMVRIDMSDGEPAKLYASNPDLGEMLLECEGTECTVSMVAQQNTHKIHKFGLNVAYLKEAAEIAAIFGDTIRLECAEELSPVSFLAPDGDNAVRFNHVVMPMRP